MSRAKKRKTDAPSFDDELPIWEFIYDHICVMELQEEVNIELFRQYLSENPTAQWNSQQLLDYFNQYMRSALYKCELSSDKILSLYKALNIEMSHHVETMLETRFSVLLRVNSERVLERFTFFSPAKREEPKLPEIEKQNVAKPRDDDELESETVTQIREHPPDIVFSDEFEGGVWKYINLHASEVSGDSLMSSQFWENMIIRSPNIQVKSSPVLLRYFKNKMIGKLLKQPLHPKLKLRLYKELRVPMTKDEKKWFLQNERIQIRTSADGFLEDWTTVDRIIEDRWDDDLQDGNVDVAPSPERQISVPGQKISTWVPRDNNPSTSVAPCSSPIPQKSTNHSPVTQLDVQHSTSRSVWSGARPVSDTVHQEKPKRVPFLITDQVEAWKYVYEKIKRAVERKKDPVLPKGITFWEEYVRKKNSPKSASNWSSHFRKQMCPTLHEMQFRRETILFLLKHIDIEVDERVHKILEKKCNARVKLTSTRHVAVWKFLDIHQDDDIEEDNEIEEDDSEDSGEEDNREVEDGSSSCDSTLPLGAEEPIVQNEEEDETNNHENADQNAVEDDEHVQESGGYSQNLPGTSMDPRSPRATTAAIKSPSKSEEPSIMQTPTGSKGYKQDFHPDRRRDCISTLTPVKYMFEDPKHMKIPQNNTPSRSFQSSTSPCEPVCISSSGNSVRFEWDNAETSPTEALFAVQRAIDCFGNDATIGMMEESVRIVFGKKNCDELRNYEDEVKEIITVTIKNIEIDEDRKKKILSQLDTLIAKAFESLGNVKNDDPYDVSARIMKTVLDTRHFGKTKMRTTEQLVSDE